MATTLYRFYDSEGDLLYVGVSDRPLERLQQHRAAQPWWLDVAQATMDHFEDRRSAIEAEVRAIRNEQPRHNVVGVRPLPMPFPIKPAPDDHDHIRNGVSDSWDFFMAEHPISTVDSMEAGVKEAVKQFLEENKADILDALTDKDGPVNLRKLVAG